MRKLTILFAALALCAGLWAIDNVKYLDANGQEQTANGVTEITNSSATLAAGWYVVKGTDVQTGTLTCQGAVHLILADGAKLTATGNDDKDNPDNSTPGIQVSGTGNSLTIYAQSMGDQMGQLKATCGFYAAGIGSGGNGAGSNITINGGTVTATAGKFAAGIGGGYRSQTPASNIKVATYLIVKAGDTENPTEEIATDRTDDTDIASSLAGKQYATTEINFSKYKAAAITEITNARQGIQNENLNNWIDGAIKDIQKGGPDATPGIDEIKSQILTVINFFKDGKAKGIEEGKAAGLAEAAAALPTDPEGTTGHTVTITKGDKTLILVNPDKVTYGKQE